MDYLLFFLSALPVVLLGLYIYKKDKNKEPGKLLTKLFLGGFSSCILVLVISFIMSALFPLFAKESAELDMFELFIYVFIGIALVEEVCKWFVTYKISYNSKEFEERFDMVVYSVFVALGFAFFENLLYVYDGGVVTGIMRALLAVPGHACDGVFMGYYLGLTKYFELQNDNKGKKKNLILSILVPTIMHGIYDYCLFTKHEIFLLIFFAFVIAVYIITIKKIKRVSSVDTRMKYRDNYCPNCGTKVESNFCPMCGRENK